MKNNIIAWLVIGFATVLLLGNCNHQNDNRFLGKLESTAAGDSVVFIDSTFTVEFEAEIKEVSGFGCHVVYDSTRIRFISAETYDHFDHELIALQNGKQGRMVIGFNQFDCQNSVKNDTIVVFAVTFHVKINASEGFSPVYFENQEVKLCNADVASEWQGLNLLIKQINMFVMRMRIK